MKKITIYILGISLLTVACNPMEDIYDELDKKENPYVEKVELTLSDADYESLEGDVAENHFFTYEEPPTNYIPGLLQSKYPALDYGSSALVTYRFSEGYPDLSHYSKAGYYSLKEDDYNRANPVVGFAQYFTPKNPPEAFLPGILGATLTDAEEGDIYIISYMYSDLEPEVQTPEEVTAYEHEFDGNNLGDFTAVNVLGDQDWYSTSYSGMGYAKMSGYSGGAQPNEDWLISPAIDLSGLTGCVMEINQAINYLGGQWDQIQVLISTDYTGGDPAAATWTAIEIPTKPAGNNWDFVVSGNVDISAFDGQQIHVAFKYLSSDSNAATWEVNRLTVKGTGTATKSGIIAEPVKREVLYTYHSGWSETKEAYYVMASDYDAMGTPGKYDNFSESDPPEKYLPNLLALKYPYALEGTEMVVVYKYYSGGTKTRADQYHLSQGSWTEFNPVEAFTDQYILTRNDGWVFDPTVIFTMTSADYQIIVDWVKTNKGSEYIDSYETQEFFFSAGSYYSNYDIRDKWATEVFSTWQDAVKESIRTVLLPLKFPDAVAQVSGIDVLYEVTFATYDGSAGEYTWIFQCTKSSPDPEFAFVGEK
jgi:hypothetical protein